LVRLSRRQQHLALDVERCVWELTAEIGRHPTPTELARATGTSVAEVDDARLALRAHHPESLHGPAGDPSDGELAIIDTLAQEDQELVAVLDRDDLRVALRMLPCAHREVVSLYYEHGLTQQEAARRVGLSQRQVSRLLGQARDRLEAICLAETG
ncbi:MAG: polymerase sigma-B factor, partial [Solirubrobacteraceae bacterium]|nr:polymerase sigma-B factor [Solirubrobacteraceae bacterium]